LFDLPDYHLFQGKSRHIGARRVVRYLAAVFDPDDAIGFGTLIISERIEHWIGCSENIIL
jgi:hypothetical protein